ncbi:Transcription factor IIIA [Meyerozyma sp. JA9]|nr:Transcription factor IIIA [Meyerozyma sp. JA9]
MASSTSSAGSSTSTKKYVCDAEGCGKSYSKPSLLEQHKRSHTGERPFPCPEEGCSKSFLRKSHLQAHLVSHKSQTTKPHHCSVCGKGVNSLQHLKRHEIIHTKSFKCTAPGCEESFYKHQSLRHHFLSVHDKSLTCSTCGKAFNRPYKLAQHNIKFHGDAPVYQCDHQGCFHNFKTWSALQLHIKTEHPKLKCSVCGKGCVGKKGLRAHMAGCHDSSTAVKLWNCDYCVVGSFAKKAELLEHYKDFHDGNIPEQLMKAEEKEKLEALLDDPEACGLENLRSLDQTTAPVDGTKSINSFNSELESGTSITDLLINNVDMKTLPCPKKKCTRRFRREHDLRRHLKWHEVRLAQIESFLASLESEEATSEALISGEKVIQDDESLVHGSNSDFDDQELDDLIDEEIASLTGK